MAFSGHRPHASPHLRDLVVERRPVLRQHVFARDDDVDFSGALAHSIVDFGKALRQRRQAGRKTGRHRGNGNSRAVQCLHCVRHHCRINANSTCRDVRIGQAKRFEDILAHRAPRLGAKPADATRRIVTGKRGEIDAGDRLDQPRRLIFLLHRPARRQRRGAAFRRRAVDGDILEPVRLELGAGVARVGMCQLDLCSFWNHCMLRVHSRPFL